ncbi:ribosome hibernation-promoting factor, HPF/YfiA family [Roseimicrobium gellanilyticum]|nr:ribosome-associated translation inhibitor RaiA [Roseimicrobium gellanilyticum]
MKTNTTTVPIHITPHHLTLTPALAGCVHGNVGKLSQYAHDALAAHVVLRRHHGTAEGKQFSASLRLAIPGRDLHASATHADLYSAITKMTRRLARLSRKRKTRRVRAARNLRRTRLMKRTVLMAQSREEDSL